MSLDIGERALTSVFDIADLMGGEEEVPSLFHAESIVLQHLAGEDDVLYLGR